MSEIPSRSAADVRAIVELRERVAMLTREIRRLQRGPSAGTAEEIENLRVALNAATGRLTEVGERVDTIDDTVSEPAIVPAPTGLVLSTGVIGGTTYIDVSWTAANDSRITAYEVLVERTGETATPIEVPATATRIEPVTAGATYRISVCSLTATRKRSAYLTRSIIAAVDTTAPGAVEGITVGTGLRSITVSWIDNPESDVARGVGRYTVQLARTDLPAAATA